MSRIDDLGAPAEGQDPGEPDAVGQYLDEMFDRLAGTGRAGRHALSEARTIRAAGDRVEWGVIIVVTVRTFRFALDEIRADSSLKGRRFAVIADEAHSSQRCPDARRHGAITWHVAVATSAPAAFSRREIHTTRPCLSIVLRPDQLGFQRDQIFTPQVSAINTTAPTAPAGPATTGYPP